MEDTTALYTSNSCDRLEWEFSSAMVVAPACYTRDVRCGSTWPFNPRSGTRGC